MKKGTLTFILISMLTIFRVMPVMAIEDVIEDEDIVIEDVIEEADDIIIEDELDDDEIEDFVKDSEEDSELTQYFLEMNEIISEDEVDEPDSEVMYEGTCGKDLQWKLYETGTLLISGNGAMWTKPWRDYASDIKKVILDEGISEITSSAFYNCKNIEGDVVVPSTVKKIGQYAFKECSALENITIPGSVTSIEYGAFDGCSSLKNVIIANGVTSIGDYAFTGCSGLEYIEVPDSVETIGVRAFENCSNLKYINIPSNLTTINWATYRWCENLENITIPEGVTSIGDGAFGGCSSLQSIILPNSIVSIDKSAFSKCSSLKNITIPEGVTSIGVYAFSECSSLISMDIPDSVTEIGDGIFYGCTDLKNINISPNVTVIGNSTFALCASLECIVIPNGVISIGDTAFGECKNLESVVIPDSVTSIGKNAFYYCDKLESIVIPEGVTAIEYGTFRGCQSLKNVEVPASITTIGGSAFYYCNSLESIILPDGIDKIEDETFGHCERLKRITVPSGVTSIGNYVFSGCNSLVSIEIPDSVTSIGNAGLQSCEYIVIKCNYNSFAETYAKSKNICYCNIGKTGSSSGRCGRNVEWNLDYSSGKLSLIGQGSMYLYNILVHAPWYADRGYISSIEIENGITAIGNFAFYGCGSLENVAIPDSVTSIGCGAFYGCGSLKDIIIPDSVTSIDDYRTFARCTSLERITIPEGVTLIGEGVFLYCTDLNNIIIPDSVNSIEGDAFFGCSRLKEIDIPSSVTYIAEDAFNGCSNITISGETNSYAEEYANRYEITFVSTGVMKVYSLIFDGNGNTSGNTDNLAECIYVKNYSLPSNGFYRNGYSFVGWNTKSDGTGNLYLDGAVISKLTTEESITLYAQWNANKYVNTLEYNANGGSGAPEKQTVEVVYPDTSSIFEVSAIEPQKKGYTFCGWYTAKEGGNKVDSSIVVGLENECADQTKMIYARWLANKYNIKFTANGGIGTMSNLSNRVYGKEYTLTANAFKKTGYSFTGWNTKADGSGTKYANKAVVKNLSSVNGKTITLYAQWKKVTYTITYKLNGGTNNTKNPTTYTVTSKDITWKTPTRKGYKFVAWYKDSSFTKKTTVLSTGSTGNRTIYAKWSPIKYTVKFNANGGTGTMKNQSATYDKALTLTKNAYKRSGYTFLGWSTSKTATTAKYKNAASVKNLTATDGKTITLYAVWKKK